ncbi:MAG: hypothetical protein PHF62_02665 [Acholeplasmataceae bacterium]|nr:hypothetical protein [Acholeplasmataceae bacterium]MDD4204007.1 hypothetical protein [Acholeplasmataceae bacterium]MDD4469207.1 hypothetical protein [Acholeplasmataceae bacterium]
MTEKEQKVIEAEVVDEKKENADNKSKESRKDKVGSFFKELGKDISDAARQGLAWTDKQIQKINQSEAFKEAYKKQTVKFKVVGTNTSFRGLKEQNQVLVKLDDQFNTKTVKINSILEMEEGTKLKVMNIDLEKAVHRELTIKGDKVPVALFAIFVKVD